MNEYLVNKTMKVEGPLHVVCQCDKCKAQEQEFVAWEQFYPDIGKPRLTGKFSITAGKFGYKLKGQE